MDSAELLSGCNGRTWSRRGRGAPSVQRPHRPDLITPHGTPTTRCRPSVPGCWLEVMQWASGEAGRSGTQAWATLERVLAVRSPAPHPLSRGRGFGSRFGVCLPCGFPKAAAWRQRSLWVLRSAWWLRRSRSAPGRAPRTPAACPLPSTSCHSPGKSRGLPASLAMAAPIARLRPPLCRGLPEPPDWCPPLSAQCRGDCPLLPPIGKLPGHSLQRLDPEDPGPPGGPAALHAPRASGEGVAWHCMARTGQRCRLEAVQGWSPAAALPLDPMGAVSVAPS